MIVVTYLTRFIAPMTQKLTFLFISSGRRRHTSLQGDWSSDVCSSDLDQPVELFPLDRGHAALDFRRGVHQAAIEAELVVGRRSEERRVGKGCRVRWRAWCCKRKGGKDVGM